MTSTSLTVSPTPSVFGEPVTFTATVQGTGDTPTGTVTFSDGATVLAEDVPVVDGEATFTTAGLAIGAHSITAAYGGTEVFASSEGSAAHTVDQAPTTTTSTPTTSTTAPAVGGTPLPRTGTDSGALAQVGLLVALAGAVALCIAGQQRRRHRIR